MSGPKPQRPARDVERTKKGQAFDMIEVAMAEQQVDMRLRIPAQLLTERSYAGARIDDEGVVSGRDLDTGGIAAEGRRVRARRRNTAAHPPKPKLQFAGVFAHPPLT